MCTISLFTPFKKKKKNIDLIEKVKRSANKMVGRVREISCRKRIAVKDLPAMARRRKLRDNITAYKFLIQLTMLIMINSMKSANKSQQKDKARNFIRNE